MEKVAIIGCGYSGSIVLHRLKNRNPNISIDLFDPAGMSGHGLAYQPDISSNLINRPSSLMWLNEPGDFSRWLCENHTEGNTNPPRALFGEFIKLTLERFVAQSTNIQFHAETVTNINKLSPKHYLVTTSKKIHGPYRAVVLATGNPEPRDVYKLSGKTNYYNSAYPTLRLLDIRSRHIGVIGNQLSAIDTTIALLDEYPDNRVTVLSRRSKLPNYSDNYEPCELNVLNKDHLANHFDSTKISLSAIRQLFDAELISQGVDISLMELMTDHTKVDIDRKKIYSILSATNTVVPHLWSRIPDREKRILSKRYAPHWRQFRVPIPKESRHKIDIFMRKGRLRAQSGIVNIQPYGSQKFRVQGDGYEEIFTHIINATGIGDSIDTPLYRNMVKHGLCRPNEHGGIRVCIDDCRIIGTDSCHDLFAIGTPTIGDFFATSNIDVLQMQAEIITKKIIPR
ncbi:FAD/NAD(P)-binding protein [Pseudomonas inefficax]|uniref:FAD/NAD(P)-binding protein n=1 Tax=Pseudomonas inefficax TaxID=2078786 RepID=UPI0032656A28